MKKNLSKLKMLTLALGLLLVAGVTNAANRTASQSGNWNSTTTWGGQSVPVAGDVVTIPSHLTVTVTANAACTSITFTITQNPSANGGITVNAGFTLAVSGAVVKNNATQTSALTTIGGAGTFNCASFQVSGVNETLGGDATLTLVSTINALNISGNLTLFGEDDGTDDHNTEFNIQSGVVTVGGTIITDEENGSSVTMTLNTGAGTGTLNLAGATPFTNSVGTLGFTATGTDATVNYTRAGNQTISAVAYTNLGVSGSGIKTPAADIAINGDLEVASGATLTLGAFDININVNAAKNATINGTLNIDGAGRLIENGSGNKTLVLGAGSFLNLTGAGTTLPTLNLFSFDATSTVLYGSGDAQTIENSATYGNLTTAGTNDIKTLETSGGTITFLGSVIIGASTTLDGNDKTINVAGNFIKNGGFTQTNTTLVLNGDAAQSLRGSTALDLNNLTINNTIAGSVVAVTVDTIINISGAAVFTDGIVSTSATEYLSFADGATASGAGLSQATDASFVVGFVRKTGNDAFSFPVGSLVVAGRGGYMPISITAPDNTGDVFAAEYTRNSATTHAGNTGCTAPLLNVSACDFWNLNEITDAGAANSISVTLSWDGGSACNSNSFITNTAGLTVAHYTGPKWDVAGVGTTTVTGNTTQGTVTRPAVTVFSPFSIGNVFDGSNPLPVTFNDVKAFAKGTGVQIEWSNLTEKDLVNYYVERSANGIDFAPISTIAPRSNNNDKESYSNFDATPFNGANFYRIKTVEQDGKINYSKLLKVDISKSTKGIVLYPNPVSGSDLSVNLTAPKGQYKMIIVNNAGQQVFAKQLVLAGGNISQAIELPAALKSGVYNLVVTGDNYRETKTFIKQ